MMKEMLKVIIVDDEALIINLIKMKVDWEKLGMEVVAQYSNSVEAYEALDIKKPDIILTDICMPNMSGIELARQSMKILPDVKVIIITGYDEFEFALDSIKIGVADYILKPINSTALMDALERTKKKIQKENPSTINAKAGLNTNESKNLQDNELDEIGRKNLLKEIIAYIDKNISNQDLNVNMVAQEFCFSTGHFCRLFKSTMRKTFGEYLSDIRYAKAKDYLYSSDLKCYEIGEKIGITDAHYLSIWFKKKSGISISKYRKNNN